MTEQKRNKGKTRREFLKTAGQVSAVAAAATVFPKVVKKASALDRDFILIGHPNPSTGPLADFGEATPWADDRALAAINKDGGIMIKEAGKKMPVKLKVLDTQSDPTKAGDAASQLILKDKVDLMVVMHTPDTVNPVTAMCERYETPCISLDCPVEAWLTGGPYEWCYHAFWTVDTVADLYIGMWDQFSDKHNKSVGILMANDPDGKEWSAIFKKKIAAKGWKSFDPGRFPYFTKDYSAFISQFKRNNCEILTGNLIGPDFTTAWRQMHQQSYYPKICTIGKAILFPSAVQALGGDLAQGLTTELWWSPYHPFKSSLTGQTAKEICDAWTSETKKQWTPPIGYKYAGFEIAADALKRAGTLEKKALLKAIGETQMTTVVGSIKYNDKHYAETPVVGGQWVKGKTWPWEIEIVNNGKYPNIKKTAEMLFPIQGK